MHKFFLVFLLCMLVGCIKSTDPIGPTPEADTFLEGQQIQGTEIFFPLGDNLFKSKPRVSPDGKFIVYEDQHSRIDPSLSPGLYILDLSTSEKRLLVEGFAYGADWSPDREWIAFNTYPQIYKIKVNGDSLTQLTDLGNNFFPD